MIFKKSPIELHFADTIVADVMYGRTIFLAHQFQLMNLKQEFRVHPLCD